jgi:SAM-dependent methyltransferase
MSYTESHKGHGRDYHESFKPEVNPYRAMLWRLEKGALDQILRQFLGSGKVAHLDFACGTGRVLGHFQGRVGSSTGLDVSASMMEVAREVAPTAEFIEADLTRQDVLGTRQFDFITAFRFFPNAEPELRRAVITALAKHLAPKGVLVFNNHKNRNSVRRRLSRLLGREVPAPTMTHAEVEALVQSVGLQVLQAVPLANLPVSEYHLLLPVSLVEPLERRMSTVAALAGLAGDVIYVSGRPR